MHRFKRLAIVFAFFAGLGIGTITPPVVGQPPEDRIFIGATSTHVVYGKVQGDLVSIDFEPAFFTDEVIITASCRHNGTNHPACILSSAPAPDFGTITP